MYVEELMKSLTDMNLNGKTVKLVLPDGSVGNIDCLSCVEETYLLYYKPDASELNAEQLLFHMEAESSNECWGDSPNFEGNDADAISKFADCEIAICIRDESDDEIIDFFYVNNIDSKEDTLFITSEK